MTQDTIGVDVHALAETARAVKHAKLVIPCIEEERDFLAKLGAPPTLIAKIDACLADMRATQERRERELKVGVVALDAKDAVAANQADRRSDDLSAIREYRRGR